MPDSVSQSPPITSSLFCLALQKHGSREGRAFPSAKGNPSAINEQGQKIVDSILNDPNKSVIQGNTGRYGQVTDVISSSGRGLRYDAQGKLIGFSSAGIPRIPMAASGRFLTRRKSRTG